jgi:hypothetical protein
MNEIARVVALSHDGCEFKHIKEFQQQGIVDEKWVPDIAKDKCWIIISADRSKQKSKGEKLRTVCKRHDVTLVELSQKIHHLPTTQKIGIILTIWPDLMKVAGAPPGTRFLIRFKGSKPGGPIIIQTDPPPTESEKDKN